MSKETGGPAFPHPELDYFGGDYSLKSKQAGMTLRDYYMAHAPISMGDALVHAGGWTNCIATLSDKQRAKVFESMALLRGEYADAMIDARVTP